MKLWIFILFLLQLCYSVSPVVIKVNDQKITKSRIDSLVDIISQQQYGSKVVPKERRFMLEKMVAGNLVGQELLFQEAKKQKLAANVDELNQLYEHFKSAFPSEQAYKEALRKIGDSEQSIRKKLEREILIEKLLKQHLSTLSVPTETSMKAFWEEHKSKFPKNDSLRASQIVLRLKNPNDVLAEENRRRELDKIRDTISQENSLEKLITLFSQFALKYSETPESKIGGDLNVFKAGDFLPEFNSVVGKLVVGELSQVFKTKLGLHLVLLTEKNDGKFENYRFKIMQALLTQQTIENQQKLESYLKKLLAKHKVTYLDERYKGKVSHELNKN